MKKTLFILVTAICSINCFAQLPLWLPQNGLVAWYPFNGNANDESGNGNNGTVNGSILTTDRNGKLNSAYSFDSTQTITGSCSSFPSENNPRSISFWYNAASLGIITSEQILGYGGNVCGQSFIMIFENFDIGPDYIGKYEVQGTCQAFRTYTSYPTPANNIWHQITVTYNNANLKFYNDGKLVFTSSSVAMNTYVLSKIFCFGTTPNPNGDVPYFSPDYPGFKGKLDDIGIWNRALTDCEVEQLYYADLVCNIPSVTIADKSILEGDTGTKQLKFTVTLSNTYTSVVKIKYKTINNTAKAGSDYITANDSLIFKPGQTKKTISITINGDTKTESDETFYVKLYKPVNATIAGDTAIGTIRNDDGAALTNKLITDEQIKSTSLTTGIKVYPNPVKNMLYIQAKGNTTFYLSDAAGKRILTKQIQKNGNINVSTLPAGLYFLKNSLTGEVQKIVVQK